MKKTYWELRLKVKKGFQRQNEKNQVGWFAGILQSKKDFLLNFGQRSMSYKGSPFSSINWVTLTTAWKIIRCRSKSRRKNCYNQPLTFLYLAIWMNWLVIATSVRKMQTVCILVFTVGDHNFIRLKSEN